MAYEVGQIVAWDCPVRGDTYKGAVTKVTARQVVVEDTDADLYYFGAKGQREGLYGGRWVLREPTKAERDAVLCALAEDRIHGAIEGAQSFLRQVKRDPKIMEAIADRADLLLKTVRGFVK